jgi:hypothetical protein
LELISNAREGGSKKGIMRDKKRGKFTKVNLP